MQQLVAQVAIVEFLGVDQLPQEILGDEPLHDFVLR